MVGAKKFALLAAAAVAAFALLPLTMAAPVLDDLRKGSNADEADTAGNVSPGIAEIIEGAHGDAIPGRYIVTMKSGLSTRDFDKHVDRLGGIRKRGSSDFDSLGGIKQLFAMPNLQAYAGKFDDTALRAIKDDPNVQSVEHDRVWSVQALSTQTQAPWGLGSISHRSRGSNSYVYDGAAGAGMFAYVVDTGINAHHRDFGNRVHLGYNAVGGDFVDTMGHGTHTAGILAGAEHGVARQAIIVAVKVFGNGASSTSTIMAGFQWAVDDIRARGRGRRAVVNLSLGGTFSPAFNALVTSAVESVGVLVVAAAGNDGQDASGYSPASADGALTVGAIDDAWRWAPFSNYGTSVDVLAPGSSVLSSWIGSRTATMYMSGTSMACPHVAGLALYLLSTDITLDSPRAVTDRIKALAAGRSASGLPRGTPNLVAYNGSGAE